MVFTDHWNLEYIWQAKQLSTQQAQWILLLRRFNIAITYRLRSKNRKADALSWHLPAFVDLKEPKHIIPLALIMAPIVWDHDVEVSGINANQEGQDVHAWDSAEQSHWMGSHDPYHWASQYPHDCRGAQPEVLLAYHQNRSGVRAVKSVWLSAPVNCLPPSLCETVRETVVPHSQGLCYKPPGIKRAHHSPGGRGPIFEGKTALKGWEMTWL